MSISVGSLQVRYSGGAANTDQMNSLGGAVSTAPQGFVLSQETGAPNPTVGGVTIVNAMGNPVGAGTIRWTPANSTLYWRRFGGVAWLGTVISGNGVYTIGDNNGYLVVAVVAASLPINAVDSTVGVVNATNRTFDNVSPAQSLAGLVEYRCFYLRNTHASATAFSTTMWIKSQPVGDDTLSIALHPGGKNSTAVTIADEADSGNALSAITWVAPSTQGAGLVMGDLSAGDYYAFWMRRTVPPDTYNQVIENTSSLAFSALL